MYFKSSSYYERTACATSATANVAATAATATNVLLATDHGHSKPHRLYPHPPLLLVRH